MRANARAAAQNLGGDGSAVAALFWDAQKLIAARTPARAKKEKLSNSEKIMLGILLRFESFLTDRKKESTFDDRMRAPTSVTEQAGKFPVTLTGSGNRKSVISTDQRYFR